jgi:hypothetical protein
VSLREEPGPLHVGGSLNLQDMGYPPALAPLIFAFVHGAGAPAECEGGEYPGVNSCGAK